MSAAISAAAGCWLGRNCVACSEIVGDVVGGVACFSAGAGQEAPNGGASGARTVWPGTATAGAKVARRVVKSSSGASAASGGVGSDIGSGVVVAAIGGGSEMIARRSACVVSPPDLVAASGASCPRRRRGSGAYRWLTKHRDVLERQERNNAPGLTFRAATKLRTTRGQLPASLSRWQAASCWRRNSMPSNAMASVSSAWPHSLAPSREAAGFHLLQRVNFDQQMVAVLRNSHFREVAPVPRPRRRSDSAHLPSFCWRCG